jgi:hypothetical protein
MDGRWGVDRPAKDLVIGIVGGGELEGGDGNYDRQRVFCFGRGVSICTKI